MRRPFLSFAALFLASLLSANELPQLLQKAKEQFRLRSYVDALTTLDRIDGESQKPGFESDRTALQPVLSFYRGASYAALGRDPEARREFEVFLVFQPNASLDPAIYPKRVVSMLEETRRSLRVKSAQPEETGSLAMAYRAFPSPNRPDHEIYGDDWAEGPTRYLLSPQERTDFSRLSDPLSRSEFITRFWKSRDPRPETPDNEFREDFEKRISFADSRFTQDEVRGSLTDRGRVFILLGAPTYIGRKPLTTGDDSADASGLSRYSRAEIEATRRSPGGTSTDKAARVDRVTGPGTTILEAADNYREVWHYRRELLPKRIPYQQVDFDFLTRKGYGKNVLQRESAALHTLEAARESRMLVTASK